MLTLQELRAFAPAGKDPILVDLVQHWHLAEEEADITTPARRCHFLAQLAHESDGFRAAREYASGAAYEGRADLGNTVPGDGRRYRGRGLIQLTGRANYRAAGAALDLPLESRPELAERGDVMIRIAAWYWRTRRLNRYADRNDIRAITKRINGGFNGLADRRAWFRKAVAIWGEGQVDEIGRPVTSSRTVKAAMVGGGVSLATVAEGVYQAQQVAEGGRAISDATGLPLLTIAFGAVALAAIAYIVWDRWWIARHEGL